MALLTQSSPILATYVLPAASKLALCATSSRLQPLLRSFYSTPRTMATVSITDDRTETDSDGIAQCETSRDLRPRRRFLGSSLLFPSFGRRGSLFQQLERDMDTMFRAFDMPTRVSKWDVSDCSLAVDVKEEDKQYILTADVPGLNKEDVKVTVSPDNVVAITGERKPVTEEKQTDNLLYVERSFGKFLRQFRLPDNVDVQGIVAKQENGVLTLTVPKVEKEEPQVHEIKVE